MNADKYSKILVKNIQSRLDSMERNRAWLAKRAELTPASISRIMTGETKFPALDSIVKIAEALNCPPNELIDHKYSLLNDKINELNEQLIKSEIEITNLRLSIAALDSELSRGFAVDPGEGEAQLMFLKGELSANEQRGSLLKSEIKRLESLNDKEAIKETLASSGSKADDPKAELFSLINGLSPEMIRDLTDIVRGFVESTADNSQVTRSPRSRSN